MATDALTQAFEVGRDQYIVDALAFRGILDLDTATFRQQVAAAGSQVWVDWLTVDAAGNVTIPHSTIVVTSVPWTSITGTPTTLAGYGITDPVVLTSGSYADPTWIPSLGAAKLTGTLQAAQFPALTGDVTTVAGALATTLATVNANVGTWGSATQVAQVTVNAKGLVTAVANVTVTPAASSITGILGLAHGGTGADLSATGGASQVLRQSGAGAAVTVGQLSISDISGGISGSGTAGTIPKWSSASVQTDSIITESSGNVGIGTSTPAKVLHVKRSGTGQLRADDAATHTADFGVSAAAPNYGAGIWAGGTQQAHFYGAGLAVGSYVANDPPAGGLIASGNVGIGTTSPSYTLDVSGTFHATGAGTFDSTLSASYVYGAPAILGYETDTGSTTPSTTTAYHAALGGSGNSLTESDVTIVLPLACTLKNLYVKTVSAQPASGSFVITVRKNGANTSLTITISAGGGAGTYSDTSHTATFAAGDAISIGLANNALTQSASVQSLTAVVVSA